MIGDYGFAATSTFFAVLALVLGPLKGVIVLQMNGGE